MLGGKGGRLNGARNYKTIIRMERAVHLEARGIPDKDIAEHIGMTLQGLATMKTKPEYKSARLRIHHGVVGELEEGLGEDLNYTRERLKNAIPKALDVLVDALVSPDPKIRITASTEILDRDGHMAKVSRIGLPTEDQGGSRLDTTIADGLITALGNIKAATDTDGQAKRS